MKVKFLNGTEYELLHAPMQLPYGIEIHYSGFKKVNHSGFKILNDNGDVSSDYSGYKYKWNVLTDLSDGVVFTDIEDNVETEDNKLNVISDEQWTAMEQDMATQEQEQKGYIDDETRLADLESAICELYEMIGGNA